MSVVNAIGNFDGTENAVLRVLDNMIWPILLLVSLAIAVLVPQTFKNYQSLIIVIHSSVALGFLVLAEGICLLSGHFDLSIGAIAGFSAMLAGKVIADGGAGWNIAHDPVVGVILVLAIGTTIGAVNGVMITKLDVNPFLQTLAFLIIFEGARISLSSLPVSGLPGAYISIGGTAGVAIGLMVLTFVVISLVMRYTPFGQAVYAIGSDEESAREVGIETDRVILSVYAISGLLSGVAGLMLTGYVGVVTTEIGSGTVFPAFAAAVIGGISLFGGRGKISGALGGVLLLGIIQSALNLSGIPISQIQMVNGLVLLTAILLYNTRTRIREEILSTETGQ